MDHSRPEAQKSQFLELLGAKMDNSRPDAQKCPFLELLGAKSTPRPDLAKKRNFTLKLKPNHISRISARKTRKITQQSPWGFSWGLSWDIWWASRAKQCPEQATQQPNTTKLHPKNNQKQPKTVNKHIKQPSGARRPSRKRLK